MADEDQGAGAGRVVAIGLGLGALVGVTVLALRQIKPSGQKGVTMPPAPTDPTMIDYMDGIQIFRPVGLPPRVEWVGDMSIDADGSPRAAHPSDWGPLQGPALGLDAPENMGDYKDPEGKTFPFYTMVRKWWGIYVDPSTGQPKIQGPGEPYPGFFVSTTALVDKRYVSGDPRRYLDSEKIPYIAVPPELVKHGVRLGDLAFVSKGGRSSFAVVGDIGPRRKIGEGSIALAVALGLSLSDRMARIIGYENPPGSSGADRKSGIKFVIFTGSSPGQGKPIEVAKVQADGARLAAGLGLV